MELGINGIVNLDFYERGGEEVSQETHNLIKEFLQDGTYLISLNEKTVVSLDNFKKILYTFQIDVSDAMEYDFDIE